MIGEMIPSGIAREAKYYQAGNSNGTLVILQNVYAIPEVQEDIYKLCQSLISSLGVNLITVEGANTQLLPQEEQLSIKELLNRYDVSAGVLKFLNENKSQVEVWGVDNLEVVTPARAAMTQLINMKNTVEQVFNSIRQLLLNAQSQYYPPDIAEIRRYLLDLYHSETKLPYQISLIHQAGKKIGLNLDDFPFIAQLNAGFGKENQINWQSAERQRNEFVMRVMNKLFNIFDTVDKNNQIDKICAQGVLHFWMDKLGLPKEEIVHNLGLRDLKNIFRECQIWLIEWIVEGALKVRQSLGFMNASSAQFVFWEELIHLAHQVGASCEDLYDFKLYIHYLRDLKDVSVDSMNELKECCNVLIDQLHSADANWLRDLEDQFALLYIALKVEMTPEKIDASDIGPGKLIKLQQNLCKKSTNNWSTQLLADLQFVDQMLEQANHFTRFNLQRSRHMIQQTLKRMSERNDEYVILVAGGFHTRSIVRILETYRRLSWSIITPQFKLPDYSGN